MAYGGVSLMGWVQIHASDGPLEFEEGREQNPHRKPSREEKHNGEEIVIYPTERRKESK